MYEFIIQMVLMLSFGAILYIVASAIPRIGESESRPSKIRAWASGLPLHRLDSLLALYRDKVLRRAKVFIMKADNFISRNLNKDKDKSNLNP